MAKISDEAVSSSAAAADGHCPLGFSEREILFQGPFSSKTSMGTITVKNFGEQILCITVKAAKGHLILAEPSSFFLKPKQEYTVVLKHGGFRFRKSNDLRHQWELEMIRKGKLAHQEGTSKVNFNYITVDEDWHHRIDEDQGDAVSQEYVQYAEHFSRIFDSVCLRAILGTQTDDDAVGTFLGKKASIYAGPRDETPPASTRVLHRSF